VEKLIRTHFCMRFHPFASRQNTSWSHRTLQRRAEVYATIAR
jgi:hypothetical protein